ERAVFLQAELSRTALDAPGMEPLAERLADLIARPVMVLDSALRPIASARWPEGHAPSQAWLRRTRLTERDPDDPPVVTPLAVGTARSVAGGDAGPTVAAVLGPQRGLR